MKKSIIISVLAVLLIPSAAWAGSWKTPFGTVPYGSGWSKHEMKMPTAGSMAGEAAKSTAISEGGSIRIADSGGWRSGGDIANQAIGAATNVGQSAAIGGIGGAVMESKIKGMVGDMAMATFKKSGKPYAEIMVTMMKGGSAGSAGMAGSSSGGGSGGGCQRMESSGPSWGGKATDFMTMRCEAGSGQYQWTSTARLMGVGGTFMMTTMYTGTAKTLAEFNTIVGTEMKNMMTGTNWTNL